MAALMTCWRLMLVICLMIGMSVPSMNPVSPGTCAATDVASVGCCGLESPDPSDATPMQHSNPDDQKECSTQLCRILCGHGCAMVTSAQAVGFYDDVAQWTHAAPRQPHMAASVGCPFRPPRSLM